MTIMRHRLSQRGDRLPTPYDTHFTLNCSARAMSSDLRIFAWGDPENATLIHDAAAELGATIVGCGSDSPPRSAELAERLGVPRDDDDLRRQLQRDDFEAIILATTQPLDAAVHSALADSAFAGVTTEPLHGDYAGFAESRSVGSLPFGPLFRFSPGMIELADAIETAGTPHTATLVMQSAVGEGSLFARLYDGVDALLSLLGACERVDAAVTGPRAKSGETLASLGGDISAHLRFESGAAANLTIVTGSSTWSRCMTLATSTSQWLVSDSRAMQVGDEPPRSHLDAHLRPGVLLAYQIRRTREHAQPHVFRARDDGEVLAVCEAARVSCRTGHSESAVQMLEMIQR